MYLLSEFKKIYQVSSEWAFYIYTIFLINNVTKNSVHSPCAHVQINTFLIFVFIHIILKANSRFLEQGSL